MDSSFGHLMLPLLIVIGSLVTSNKAATNQNTDAFLLQDSVQNEFIREDANSLISGSPIRKKRSVDCPVDQQITAATTQDAIMPMEYPAPLLDACLDNNTLIQNLANLGGKAFSEEQLAVLKRRLDQIYPNGLPEALIPQLGSIGTLYGADDMNKWNITTVNSLAAILKACETDAMAKAVIARYLAQGNSLNATVLDTINAVNSNYVCLLDEAQLSNISASAIRTISRPIDISSCTQPKKNIIFNTALNAFAGVTNATAKYSLIKPYIGGATADYLKALAKTDVVMDFPTFLQLNPLEVPKLTVDEVKALLSTSFLALKDNQDNPVVKAWIQSQRQTDLDKLGIGLTGGIQDCPAGMKITSQNVGNILLPLSYTPSELDVCLDNDTLRNNLSSLGEKAFSDEQLAVLKRRLYQLYPNRLPDDVIRKLGNIATIYSPSDISTTWNISTPTTLAVLLHSASSDDMAKIFMGTYLNQGNPLDAAALNAMTGYYLCLLDENQLQTIPPAAIKGASPPLNISTCTQTKKNILYGTAATAFSEKQSDPATYYMLMKPYLCGASANDLRNLAQMNISMDLPTFVGLNPAEVLKLTTADVSNLLGKNLPNLAQYQNYPVVSAWIKSQKQSDLNRLDIGLQGGLSDPPIGFYNIPQTGAGSSGTSSSRFCFLYLMHTVFASIILIPLL